MSFTGENLFSRTGQVESTPKSLTKQRFARTAAGKSPGLSAKRSRKPRRVLYPSQVRRYLPRQEADSVKRWLLFLIGVILMQIFTENPDATAAPEDKYANLVCVQQLRRRDNYSRTSRDTFQVCAGLGQLGDCYSNVLPEPKLRNIL
uniref:Radiation-inducible immediate-early gene IEX-1 n=1 Tax=Terrapene triunguis TaxID=2587831 RepID=A0A674IE49_9SAUR